MRRTIGSRRTPSPPTSPPGPSHEHAEHARPLEPVFDLDGPSKDESEDFDEIIVAVVIQHHACRREGCDAADKARYYYTMDGCRDAKELVDACVKRSHADVGADEVDGNMIAEMLTCRSEFSMQPRPLSEDSITLDIYRNGSRITSFTPTKRHMERKELGGGPCHGQPLDPRGGRR